MFAPGEGEESIGRADTTMLEQGFATVTLVDGDIAASGAATEPVQEWLGELAP